MSSWLSFDDDRRLLDVDDVDGVHGLGLVRYPLDILRRDHRHSLDHANVWLLFTVLHRWLDLLWLSNRSRGLLNCTFATI